LDNNNLGEILTKHKTIAVVGLSRDPSKDSHIVAEYLRNHCFRIIPVNPFAEEIFGEKCYKSLIDMPAEVKKTLEIVDVFRPSEEVLPIVKQVVQLKKLHGVPYVVWMQLGIINDQAAEIARKAAIAVVMDKCMMQEHQRLFTKNGK